MSSNSKLSTRLIKNNMDVLHHLCHLPDDLTPSFGTILKDTEIFLFQSLRDEIEPCNIAGPNCAMPHSCISFQPLLAQMLWTAPDELIGLWSSGSVCSFCPTISVETFSTLFGQKLSATELDYTNANLRISQFANCYWLTVREFGIKAPMDAAVRFQLPEEIVQTIAITPPHKIFDFCFGYPDIQRFVLTCGEQDLLNIGTTYADDTISDDVKSARITLLRHIKTCHSAKFRHAAR